MTYFSVHRKNVLFLYTHTYIVTISLSFFIYLIFAYSRNYKYERYKVFFFDQQFLATSKKSKNPSA